MPATAEVKARGPETGPLIFLLVRRQDERTAKGTVLLRKVLVSMNFSGVTALLVQREAHTMGIISRALRGFGLQSQLRARTGAEAKKFFEAETVNICFCETDLADMRGVDLVRWVRRHASDNIRYVSVILLCSYTQLGSVAAARDAGANFLLKKPLSPKILYDRLAWSVTRTRKFIETDDYAGPDRRFKSITPPGGVGRRSTDPPPAAEAGGESLSQPEASTPSGAGRRSTDPPPAATTEGGSASLREVESVPNLKKAVVQ
jgi:DNA-binding response OmpR family regulator